MKTPIEKPRLRDRIYNYFPTLEREDRKQLAERIAVGADGGVDFFVMMLLAVTLASLGVREGSTAGVIGAMLASYALRTLLKGEKSVGSTVLARFDLSRGQMKKVSR